MRLIKSFIQGIMNKDLDERLVPDGQYRDALNIEVTASEGDGVGAVENIKGNINVTNQTFTPDAKTIGAIADDAKGDIYWFVADTDYDYVLKYNEYTAVTTTLLKDDKAVDPVLNFDSRYLITGVNIIDNLLFWTDDLNPPRRLNVDRVYTTNDFIEDDISVIVRPPIYSPNITLQNSQIAFQENNLKYKFLQFACRYKYENDEYSPICPFSATAFRPGNYLYSMGNDSFVSMTNSRNEVKVDYYINGELISGSWVPDERIKEVQLLFRDTFNTNINVIESFNIEDITIDIDSSGRFSNVFNNSKIYTVLPPDEITRLFDNVPLKAKSQELIGSRIAYGNYVQFYDITDSVGAKIDIDYDLELIPTPITSDPLPTFRSDRDYEIGLVYMDDYNRMTTVLTSESNTININPSNSDTSNDIQVNIHNEAPSFANKYRIFIKQPKGDYYNIFPFLYYKDGIYTWFQIDPSEVDKVPIGEYVILKVSGGDPSKNNKQYKILDIKSQPKDFLDNGDSQAEGLYFKLNLGATILSDDSVFEGSYEGYHRRAVSDQSNSGGDPKALDYIFYRRGVVNAPIYYGNSNVAATNSLTPIQASGVSYISAPNPDITRDYRLKILIISPDPSTPNVPRYRVDHLDNPSVTSSYQIIKSTSNIDLLTQEIEGVDGDSGIVIYKFQFKTNIGFTVGDYWIVNIANPQAEGQISPGSGGDPGGLSISGVRTGWIDYGIIPIPFQTAIVPGPGWEIDQQTGFTVTSGPINGIIEPQDRAIKAGSFIKIRISEYFFSISPNNFTFGGSTKIGDLMEFQSDRDYVNIEEWFWESGAYRDFKHETHDINGTSVNIGCKNVFFRRGIGSDTANVSTSGCVAANMINQNTTPPEDLWEKTTYMMIRGTAEEDPISTGTSVCSVMPWITVSFDITQLESPVVFESTPLENDADIYYELSDTLDIINGAHQGNTGISGNQIIGAQPAVVSLNNGTENSNYNAYCFGNGVEGARIRGGFNEPVLKYSPRVSSIVEDYRQQRVEEAITYSGVYRENTGINNLNEFNLSLANFKYIDKFFGSIQKLYARDTDLVVFQENKVSKVLYGKNILSDSVGGGTVASIPEVLGTQVTYTGEYGIAEEPESFAAWGNDMYFTDSNRGAVMRLGANGMFEISSQGMRDYFKDLFQGDKTQKIGAIDPFKNRYVLTSNNEGAIPCDFIYKPISANFDSVGNSAQSVQIQITSTSTWSIYFTDTGDGISWLTINGVSPTFASPLIGYGNQLLSFVYDVNPGPSNRSLGITFSGCDSSYPETTTQYKSPKIIRHVVNIGNPIDVDLGLNEKYDFTSNTTGGEIEFNEIKLNNTEQAQTFTYTNYEGRNSIPTEGDTVDLKASEVGTSSRKSFSPDLGNELRYLVTDTPGLENEIPALIGASTLLVPSLVAGEYVGSFTYNRPSDEKHLYLIYDYRNNITSGGTLDGSAAITGTVNSFIDYGASRGNIRIDCVPSGTNRFIAKWNDQVVADSGDTAVPVALEFFKNDFESNEVQLTVEGGGAWSVTTSAPTLTAFDIDLTDETIATVCTSPVVLNTRYHSGASALPISGDIIYNDTSGSTLYDGNNSLHKIGPAGTDYAFINKEGAVAYVASCTTCAGLPAPVITQPAITLNQGDSINLKIPVTNDPEEWAVVTTCLNYELKGGTDGAIFTITNCTTGASEDITIQYNANANICSSSAPVLVSGTGTFVTNGTCDSYVLPPGISLDRLNGKFTGIAERSGIYTFDITATNCTPATSVNTSITITVNPPTENKRFNMDQGNPKTSSGDACTIVAPYAAYSILYHDGEKDYPEINDFVFEYCDCKLRPFNGGYLWYVTDEISGGKNYVIRIDSAGQVVDKTLCP